MTQTKYILRNDPKQKYTVGDEWVSSHKRGNKQSNHKRSDDSKQSSNLIVKSIAATGNDSPDLSVPEEEEVETVQAPVEKCKCRKCELVFDKII